MDRFSRDFRLAASACLAAALIALDAADSAAGFAMRISSGASSVLIVDQSSADEDGGVGGLGGIEWHGDVGNFRVSFAGGMSTPMLGEPSAPNLFFDGSLRTRGAGGTLTIELSQTGFTGTPSGLDIASFLSTFQSITGGITSMETWIGLDNGLFNASLAENSIRLSDINPSNAPGDISGREVTAVTDLNDLFSLTMIIQVTHHTVGPTKTVASALNAELQALPEPSMAAVWVGMGACVSAGGVYRRWRRA